MSLTLEDVRARLVALLADLDAPAPALPVPLGANLQGLLDAAPSGAVFAVPPGVVFTGALTIRKPVTLVTAGAWPVRRCTGPEGLGVLQGTVVIEAPDVTLRNLALVGTAKGNTVLTTGLRSRIDGCLVRGSALGQHRGIAVNSRGVTITRTRVDQIWSDQDTQAIAGWTGTAALVVEDCALEASGENVLFGGADPASADAIPTDMLITKCELTKDLAWRTQTGVTCKNLLELKNAKRVVVSGCTGTYSWLSGQTGFAILLTVRNQEGTAPYSTIEDVVIEDNVWRHLGAGVQILGRDDSPKKPSQRLQRVTLRRNRFEDVDPMAWGGAGRLVQISGGPADLTLDGNVFEGAHINSALTFDDVALPTERLIVTGNRFLEGTYGIKGPGVPMGTPTLEAFAPGYVWTNNVMVKGDSGRVVPYPKGTTMVTA